MFERPLLQDNIWENLWNFNRTYLISRQWPLYLGVLFVVLLTAIVLLRKYLRNDRLYQGAFSDKIYAFDAHNIGHILALSGIVLAVVLTDIYMLIGENSLFENYDLMAINTTRSMRFGLVASFDYIRVIPLASWYLSTLYAVTQNIIVIKAFVLLQTMLMVWALYAFFNYIPVVKRSIMIALLLITPTVLQTANIIFPERDMVIVLMLGLICARKYVLSHKVKWAAAFIFFLNVAMYTKETCITFYFGVLLTSIVYNVLIGKIDLNNVIRPWQIIKFMPLEFLMGLSLLGYLITYTSLQSGDNFYVSANQQPLLEQLINYRMETIVLLIALGMALYQMIKNYNTDKNPFLSSGLLIGALCSGLLVVVILRLSPSTPHLVGRSYYMLVSMIFAWAYLFEKISNKLVLGALSAVVLIYSLAMNINYKLAEKGPYYRDVAEFMADNSTTSKPTAIFLQEGPYATKILWQWIVETWATSYRYYFNDRVFLFKSDAHHLDRSIIQKMNLYRRLPMIYFPIITQPMPLEGDWVIINKNNHSTKADMLRKEYKDKLVHENALFEIYEPK